MSILRPCVNRLQEKTVSLDVGTQGLAVELNTSLILSVAVLPANSPDALAASDLAQDISSQGLTIGELQIDRGYINAAIVDEIIGRRGEVICRPWVARNGKRFSKRAFAIDVVHRTIECPAGVRLPIVFGRPAKFPKDTCGVCPL